jgi:hypothetical protein
MAHIKPNCLIPTNSPVSQRHGMAPIDHHTRQLKGTVCVGDKRPQGSRGGKPQVYTTVRQYPLIILHTVV